MGKVLHIASNPATGVWSVMRTLSYWQAQSGDSVALGLLLRRDWSIQYRLQLEQLRNCGIQVYLGHAPKGPGTAAFIWHSFKNPLMTWAEDFVESHDDLVLHFHNAWLSGALIDDSLVKFPKCVTYHGIACEHTLSSQPLRLKLHTYWARRAASYGAIHVSVDDKTPCTAQALFGLNAQNFRTVANACDDRRGSAVQGRREYSPSAPLTVGHLGVLDQGKGWRLTAEAVYKLRQSGINVGLVIAGSGPLSVDAEKWCLDNSSFATFLGQVFDPSTGFFPKIDVLAVPSLTEGLPMVLVEAFSHGIPVICTAVGGMSKAVKNGVNGYLIERNSAAIAERLLLLYKNPAEHQKMSEFARTTYEKYYTVERMGLAYRSAYSDAYALTR